MVIRKINSIFARHGRVLFGIVTVVIVISFMGILRPGGLGDIFSNWGSKNAYGEIFGETVSRNDLVEKADRDLIINDVIYNIGLNSSPSASKVEASAFSNLCLLAAAKRRGITVSNKEIYDFITERTKFLNTKTKTFDKKLLSNYIDGELKANGFSADELDLAVREYLINSKLLDELQNSVVVTQDEVKEFYRLLDEKYYVSYAMFDKAQYIKKIKVSKEEAKKYFEGYTPAMEDYIPGKSKVLLVEFKYNTPEIQKLVAKKLSPKVIKDFYDKNKKMFMSKAKGAKKAKAIPFAKAQSKAKKILAERYAKKIASEKAAEFAEAAYDVVGEAIEKKQREVFEALLKKFKYKAVKTGWFGDNDQKIGAINERELVREISTLREVPVSNHVSGKNAAYVAFVTVRAMPRTALFEEIENKIIIRLKDQKALSMARSQAREMVAKLQKMNGAKRLKTISTSKAPKFKLLKAFSLMAPPRIQYGNEITEMAKELANSEVAPARRTLDGSIVVVLRKRVLPAMKGFAKKQKMLSNIYKRQKVSVAQGAFSAWLQTKCKQVKRQ